MSIKDKILYLNQQFVKSADSETEDKSIYIEGYANCTSVDRTGDVIPMTAWNKALDNYLKNPIILAHHKYSEPIGRMIEHQISEKGLWIKARISAAAEDTYNLIKDGILSAFSVGFIVKDAVYDSITDLFIIKELELLEVSVVAVPMNQDSLFSLSKSFENDEDYSNYKSQFAKTKESTKELDPSASQQSDKSKKEWNMDPKDLEQLLAKAAADAATAATKAMEDKLAAEKAAAEAETKRKAEIEAAVKTAIEVGQSGAEKLLAEVEKRFNDQADAQKKTLDDLQGALKEKADEIAALQKSKMQFSDKSREEVSYADREKAVLAAKIMGKSIEDTKFGNSLIQKVGTHVGNAVWELEVSTNMEAEIRRRLVISPLLREIAMQTNVMTIPVNPDAGFATWMANSSFGTTASPGAAQVHAINTITLNAYKVATMEYLNFEEEEDSLLVLLPIIRDAMVRRVAKAVDKAYAYGAGTGADPVKGLALYDPTSATTVTSSGTVTVANLRALRKDADVKVWGLDPSDIFYVVSTDAYFDLLEDTLFQTVDKIGDKATLLTGQIGSIGNSPVLVSDTLHAKTTGSATTNTNIGALCVAPANFIGGSQRGLRFDTDNLVETQRKVLVASLRRGFTQMSTVNGSGVAVLRWT